MSTSTTSGARGDGVSQGFIGFQAHHGQSGIGGQDARDSTGPFRIVVGQQDFQERASLLRMENPVRKAYAAPQHGRRLQHKPEVAGRIA
jgi:hypothetical protein